MSPKFKPIKLYCLYSWHSELNKIVLVLMNGVEDGIDVESIPQSIY